MLIVDIPSVENMPGWTLFIVTVYPPGPCLVMLFPPLAAEAGVAITTIPIAATKSSNATIVLNRILIHLYMRLSFKT